MITAVNICGIPHTINYTEDKFNMDVHMGQINYAQCEILINKDMPEPLIKETICHEIVHGMLVHIGYNDLCNDERFVQALGNAISQTFTIQNIGCECNVNK